MGVVMRAATLPLRRRLVGTLVMLAGILLVALGFFADLRRGSATPAALLSPEQLARLPVPLGQGTTAASILQHTFDHGLRNGDRIVRLADLAMRAGVLAMAAGAALAAVLLVVPWLRGLAGLMAGIGLLGDALIAGNLVGADAQLHLAGAGASLSVQIGPGVWVCAAGFVAIMVGGALAAIRPLAGLVSGISLSVLGAGLGAGLALLVGGDRLAAAVGLPRPF